MLSRRRLLLVAVLATLAAVVVGGLLLNRGGPGDLVQEPPEPPTTPLAEYDATRAAPGRAPFCEAIDPAAVEELLGGAPTETTIYGNGDPVPDRVEDLSHEFGCVLAGRGAERLRAWIFVPPIGDDRAEELVEAARTREGCRPVDGQEFGSPGLATVCEADGVTTASYQGRFGDAWLSCDAVGSKGPEAGEMLRERAGRWCVAVLEAAIAGREIES